MSDSTGTLWKILNDDGPVAAIFYESPEAREQLVRQACLVAPEGVEVERVRDVTRVFGQPNVLFLLTPEDEEAAVLMLHGRREALRDRTRPAVLFLLRGGAGHARLRTNAAGLASWLGGMEYEPERAYSGDLDAERGAFTQREGRSPEEWLDLWRRQELPDTLENNMLAHEAMLIEIERR